MSEQKLPKIRCAIYTRKSTEEGLDQDFNSLDAQRDSAEAYIASQKSQGWICLPEHYDDGGFTGGNMQRPALARLLDDIDAGKIDCIVVYKVDRLSRSLIDFVKILEHLETSGVSFVSVTQQFNTTTSMGRLTLNILLSFAQFEREVISERTRDKIALAKKRGKYTGGRPALGYDLAKEGGKLIVNKFEASRVKTIFELYCEHKSLLKVADELAALGWETKSWTTKKGIEKPSKPFNKKLLSALLSNQIYVGKIKYKDELYAGEHDAIISQKIFDEVQKILAENRLKKRDKRPAKVSGILNGILRCKNCGCAMTHSKTSKSNKEYRYYVCQNASTTGWKNCPHPSLPAAEIEKFIVDQIIEIGFSDSLFGEVIREAKAIKKAELSACKKRLKLLEKDANQSPKSIENIRQKLIKLQATKIQPAALKQQLKKFTPAWQTLTRAEKWRMLSLILKQAEFCAQTETVELSFNFASIMNTETEAQSC